MFILCVFWSIDLITLSQDFNYRYYFFLFSPAFCIIFVCLDVFFILKHFLSYMMFLGVLSIFENNALGTGISLCLSRACELVGFTGGLFGHFF